MKVVCPLGENYSKVKCLIWSKKININLDSMIDPVTDKNAYPITAIGAGVDTVFPLL